jgi:hypothetical protein
MIFWWSGKINKDYGWEFCGGHFYRCLEDGLDVFNFQFIWDRYLTDHSPRLQVMLVILNYKIFEFNIYYLHHRDYILEDICISNSTSSIQPNTTSSQDSQTSETR